MEIFLISLLYISLFISLYWLQVIFINEKKGSKLRVLPSISIAIPAYNEEGNIVGAIKSLLGLDYPRDKVEIIVVDDGSSDRTSEIVNEFKNVKLIRQKNAGKAAALNTSIRNARGDLFACLDADSRVQRDALKKIINHFSDKDVASVICAIRVEKPKNLVERLQWYEYLFSAFVRRLLSKVGALNMTPGVFSVYRRDVLVKVGGFDEGGLTEDFEMAMRLHKNMYNIKIENSSVGYTKAPDNFGDLIKQRERWARGYIHNGFKYRDMFFNRRYGVLGTFHLPATFLGVVLLIATTSIVFFRFIKKFLNSILDLLELRTEIVKLFNAPDFRFLLNVNNMLYFPIIVGLIIVLYSFYRAHKLAGERLRYPLTFVVYIMYYGLFHSLVWCKAIAKEVIRTKRRW